MPEFDIVFQKLAELTGNEVSDQVRGPEHVTPAELDEIEELRRFSSEIQEPEPPSFVTT